MTEDSPALSLRQWLPYRMFIVSGRIAQTLTDFYGQTYGLSQTGWRILATIADRPGATAQEVGRACTFDQVTVSRGVGHLVSLGFITRRQAANDRRYAVLDLTPTGRDAYAAIAELATAAETRLHATLSEEERDLLDSMLERLEGASAGIEAAGWRDLARDA
ncbi:MAG: MarR family winged helix-turn-helix transcriptional regulator [Thalassobaculaceae bacterium]|nr:MarR family winged helix-turn-helix transcriptional regulator [Thalassobaculaceae bacterium]